MTTTLRQLKKRIDTSEAEASRDLVKLFAEALFGKAPTEFLDEFDAETLHAMAVRGLDFMDLKQPDEIRVRVYNPSFQADGWEAPYSAVELTVSDRPFIVDSMRAELRRHGVALYHLLHPILEVGRDDDGKIVAIGTGGKAKRQEAFELYLVERLDDSKRRGQLESSLYDVLGDVVLATDDYPPMRKQVQELRDYLRGLRERCSDDGDLERAEEFDEYAEFMNWLDQDNFVFLGYREYDIFPIDNVAHLQITPDSALGILRKTEQSGYQTPVPLRDIPEGLRERVMGGKVLIVTKTNAESTVHRPARMDYIGLKKLDDEWNVLGEQRFVGLFTSKALSTPVEEIPILRRKLRQVLERDRAIPGSHDFKEIVSIFNSMPREELFWSDAERLHKDIRTIMGMARERGVRLSVRPDPLGRGLAVMVIMPRDRFNAEVRRRIQRLLKERLKADHVDYQLAMGQDEEQVRFHFFFTTELSLYDTDVALLEREVGELTRSWNDHLLERLVTAHGEMRGRRLADKYQEAFDERYKADNTSLVALQDIEFLERIGDHQYLVDIVNPLEDRRGEGATHLKIYHREPTLVLSEVLPLLENLGFRVLEQISYLARLPQPTAQQEPMSCGIDIFRVQNVYGKTLEVRAHGQRLKEAISELLLKRAENDRLNQLALYAGLSIRQVALLRTYQMYYAQINLVVSRAFINNTLLAHPAIARTLYRAFEARFDPEVAADRAQLAQEVREELSDALQDVASLPEDRALRGLFNLVEATVRTNFYQDKPYIALKIDSSAVESMPEPRPFMEIAVAGPGVEGAHLRGGKVARGGIRWSDRPDDFRTEVLGLMKTQMTKNAVIVPVGSKGGFVVKGAPERREELRRYVQSQYRTYVSALLDVTDNIVDGKPVHPEGLVVYDDFDPYLVVAADKGTATYSDVANEIAASYDFWLGDAFASGGTYGYDHKKEGITARGAWECVKRHFREMNVDVMAEPISVVGIGDMSGDVFGNGMLYTRTIRLKAAFNHQHIFLDPDPDAEVGYAERLRLFELSRSTWEDYDRGAISPGGGVFHRHAKSIPLTPQIRAMLGIDAEALSGQDLIKAILHLPVDLLWNGGIGTYVKATFERHADVGDSSNDPVRIDATEVAAKVVGEGGNLGFTQSARVEYALAGGRINTDAIDNSGGVDMSDREVNIKILLGPLVKSGDLSLKQRNSLLVKMTDGVSRLVLRDNYMQSLALSLAQDRSRQDLPLFEGLQDYLTERGALKPDQEYLPTRRGYEERRRLGEGLVRPELAILLAYAKMGVYRRLLETDFPDEEHFQHYLFEYFPKELTQRFREQIREHTLRREIVATQFTNTVVDLFGITFVHRMLRDTGATPVEVMRSALIAIEILEVRAFFEQLVALDGKVAAQAQYKAIDLLVQAVEGVVGWMLLSDLSMVDLAKFIGTYREPLRVLRASLESVLPSSEIVIYGERRERLVAQGIPEDVAGEVATFDYLPSAIGVVDVCSDVGVELEDAARAFYWLGERLSLGWLRDTLAELPSESKWEKIALGGMILDLRKAQRDLTTSCFASGAPSSGSPDDFLRSHPRLLSRYDQALEDVRQEEQLGLASGGVLVRILAQIVEESARERAGQ